jgi:hypothetical protein
MTVNEFTVMRIVKCHNSSYPTPAAYVTLVRIFRFGDPLSIIAINPQSIIHDITIAVNEEDAKKFYQIYKKKGVLKMTLEETGETV